MIELNKKYRTRDGREVRIYAVDGGGPFPVHGAYKVGGDWYSEQWPKNGSYGGHDHDLFEVLPEVTVRREVFYDTTDDTVFTTRNSAEYHGMPHIGTIDITHNGKEIIKVEVVK